MDKTDLGSVGSMILGHINVCQKIRYGELPTWADRPVSEKDMDFYWEMYCATCKVYTEEDAINQLK